MFESIFEFLFKYRPLLFEQGQMRFSPSPAVYVALVLAMAGAASTLVTYRQAAPHRRLRDRLVLTTLRMAALAVVVFCLYRPVLIVRAAVAQQNFVGVLVDDSKSMRIADLNGEPRTTFVTQQLAGPDGKLLAALSNRFVVRLFRFSSSAERLPSVGALSFSGTQTKLGEALERARDELTGLPLAGLVMVTDGADTTDAPLTESLLALKADGIPVFTVGIGRDTVARDIQVSRTTTPRAILKGSSLVVDVTLTQTGYGGSTVPVNVESEGRILSTKDVKLGADGEPVTVRMRFTADEPGAHVIRFRVPPQTGETVSQNNVREALLEVRDRREKILYFEGEPRFEAKFIRRAVADDKNLQVVLLQRTAENKYLRLDVDQADELIAGFPKTREELFGYRGLVLGSIEAGAFTGDQLRMIADFVDRRGGGLLTLGGKRAFADGGYIGTPLADVLPVVLEQNRQSDYLAHLTVAPTRAGATHAATQIAATEEQSSARWKDLPQVTSVNPIFDIKPGGTLLLTGADERRRNHVVLASQRYGRGVSIAFPIQDSWIWQLHAQIPVTDMTHETLWRQLLRWLVDEVPDRITTRANPDRVEAGESVALFADVVDSTFVEVNNGRVIAHVTGPSGSPVVDVAMQWTGERNGEYKGTFTPPSDGLYQARVEATREGVSLGESAGFLRAAPSDSEYFDAAMHAPLLRRVAEETGGRFYTPDSVASLPEDLNYSGRGVTSVEERDLWDMPILLLLLVGLVLGEWTYRRAMGLA